MNSTGQLFVVAAPSGAGKTSLVNALVDIVDHVAISISHTTRPPRPDDRDGVDYHFVSAEIFKNMQEQDEFLESAKVFQFDYGTSKTAVQAQLDQGNDVILEIDWQGARQIRERFANVVSIFILPPSLDTLRVRLTGRQQDDDATIALRMDAALNEIAHYDEFDYLVVNDDFQQALGELSCIVRSQRLSTSRQQSQCRDLIQQLLDNSAEIQ